MGWSTAKKELLKKNPRTPEFYEGRDMNERKMIQIFGSMIE